MEDNAFNVARPGKDPILNAADNIHYHTLRQKNRPAAKNITPRKTAVKASSDPSLMFETNSLSPFLTESTRDVPLKSTLTGASTCGD